MGCIYGCLTVSGTCVSLGCYLRAHPLRDRAWVEQLYHICTTPNSKICFTWLYWDIKISKCLYINLKKMVEFCNLSIFWCLSERNYKIQLYYITLYWQCWQCLGTCWQQRLQVRQPECHVRSWPPPLSIFTPSGKQKMKTSRIWVLEVWNFASAILSSVHLNSV